MKAPHSSADVFRFGPFEFRPDRGKLRKFGRPLKLQPQPARLLALLINNAGEVVKREEIQEAVWGGDTQVDYELGVNRCIRQIRSVLLDNPDAPFYIRTIPRQGYSFIAAVEKPPRDGEDSRPSVDQIHSAGVAPLPTVQTLATDLLPAVDLPMKRAQAPQEVASLGLVRPAKPLRWIYRLPPIFTDGFRIYFSVVSGAATSEIAQVAAMGSETSIVPSSLPSPILLDFSPSRSQF
ncbi:MAG TPA: transcriptional regulator, partial [Edaphobacter sp.]|nr:transcriptional regulator [Edaphobacter sp.]